MKILVIFFGALLGFLIDVKCNGETAKEIKPPLMWLFGFAVAALYFSL